MKFSKLSTLSAFGIALSASTAIADVTSQQVWDEIVARTEIAGLTLSVGETETSGGGLSLRDIVAKMDQDGISLEMSLPDLRLTDRGDGGVDFILASDAMTIEVTPEGEETVEINAIVSTQDLEAIYSGDPGAMVLNLVADRIDMKTDGISFDGEPLEGRLELAMINIQQTSQFGMSANDRPTTANTGTIETVEVKAEFTDPEDGYRQAIKGGVSDVTFQSEGEVPNVAQSTFLPTGNISSNSTFGEFQASVDMESDGGVVLVDLAGSSGFSDYSTSDAGIDLSGGITGAAYRISGTAVPMGPIEIGIGASTYAFKTPGKTSTGSQPFALSFGQEDIVLSETFWSTFDPGGHLSRDPARLRLGFSGTVKIDEESADAEFDPMMMTGFPAEIESLVVEDISIAALGAEFSAKGEFEFGEAGEGAIPNLPFPIGYLDLNVLGLNNAMESLTRAGLMPPGQSGMVQMMLGMFAVPGSEPDSLESRIEIGPDGSITANGQRLR